MELSKHCLYIDKQIFRFLGLSAKKAAALKSQKEVLNFLDKSCSDYDYLLDRYEMGTGAEMYDSFFAIVR